MAFTMERMSSMGDSIPPMVLGAMSRVGALGLELTAALLKASAWKPAPDGFAMSPAGINLIATNVPGPQAQWYFAGHKVTDSLGLRSLGGNLGYGVAINSYNQYITFSMMADARMMPDVAQMKLFIAEAFNELKERIPAEDRAKAA